MTTPTFLSKAVAKNSLRLSKNSPKLLFVGGVAGTIGSTVLACRATLKLEEVLDKGQADSAMAHQIAAENEGTETYTSKDLDKDLTLIKVRTVVGIGKLYAPAVTLGVASIGMLTKSHNMLSQRNAALTAAYVALDKGFNEYRGRVIAKYGEDQDRLFRYETEEVVVANETTGKDETLIRVAPGAASIYARFFDEYSTNWSKDPEINKIFLNCQQNYANDVLRSRGHLFLNEVYDMLGIERSKAGQVVGWMLTTGIESGDNYVDFGVFNASAEARDFVHGREGSILLDFNVDGVIFDKLDSPKEAIAWQN